VYVDGALTATVTGTTYSLSGLTAGTAYSTYIVAVDNAENVSSASSALKATTSTGAVVDTQAPSVPSGLAAKEVTDTGILLSWTASTDNVSTTGYDIFLDGTLAGSTAETSFIVSGLTKLTAYTKPVSAKDAAGNKSDKSAALKVTTVEAGTLSAIEFSKELSYKVLLVSEKKNK
jgi:chitodextrinase